MGEYRTYISSMTPGLKTWAMHIKDLASSARVCKIDTGKVGIIKSYEYQKFDRNS